jgi:hypothetical protein
MITYRLYKMYRRLDWPPISALVQAWRVARHD